MLIFNSTQVKEIWPLSLTEDLVGAIQHPED
jgi:hypothetical protein